MTKKEQRIHDAEVARLREIDQYKAQMSKLSAEKVVNRSREVLLFEAPEDYERLAPVWQALSDVEDAKRMYASSLDSLRRRLEEAERNLDENYCSLGSPLGSLGSEVDVRHAVLATAVKSAKCVLHYAGFYCPALDSVYDRERREKLLASLPSGDASPEDWEAHKNSNR